VNETAHGIGGEQPYEPQHNENDSDSIEHSKFPFFLGLAWSPRESHGPSTLNDSDQDNDNGDDKKNVYEAAHGGGREYPKEPQHDENNSDSV